jgi:hypothetical protein
MRPHGVLSTLLVAILFLAIVPQAHADEATVDAQVTANPLAVSLYVAPRTVRAGHLALATGIVRNLGDEKLTGLQISLRFEPLSLSARSLLPGRTTTLAAGGEAGQLWTICGAKPGLYMVMVSAVAVNAAGEEIRAESEARVLTITGKRDRCDVER